MAHVPKLPTRLIRPALLVALVNVAACTAPESGPCVADPWTCGTLIPGEIPGPYEGMVSGSDPLRGLPRGEAQRVALCRRLVEKNVGGVVRDRFCGEAAPPITSLNDALSTLGLGFHGVNSPGNPATPGTQQNPDFALIGHSTSLTRRVTNVLNPRAIIMTPSGSHTDAEPGFVVAAFTRGETFVEIISDDPTTREIHFFLLTFKLPCEAYRACTPAHLFSPAIESEWQDVTLYDETDLENTPLDCLHCHKNGWRGNPEPRKSLLMFEQNPLWRHWLYTPENHPGWIQKPIGPGPFQDQLKDFLSAHGEAEPYAGIPGSLKRSSRPLSLQCLIEGNGYGNGFDTNALDKDGRGEGFYESYYNKMLQPELAAMQLTGEIFAAPSAMTDPADKALVSAASAAYAAFLTDPTGPFPDLPAIVTHENQKELNVTSPDDISPATRIIQSCSECHHSGLNQGISRALFNMDLRTLPTAELRQAQRRINLPLEALGVMPPTRIRSWTGQQRAEVTDYLQTIIDGRGHEPPTPPSPNPPTFLRAADLVAATAALLWATPGHAVAAPVEYRFEELSGNAGATDSGWQLSPVHLDRGLTPETEYRYVVTMRTAAGVEGEASAALTVLTPVAQVYCLPTEVDADCDGILNTDEKPGDSDNDGVPDMYDPDDDAARHDF